VLSEETTRAGQKAATRVRILDAARLLLERSGYEAANIRAIAKEAGVSTGAVLLHFKDKQDLLHAALHDDLELAWRKARARTQHKTLEGALAYSAKSFFDYYARWPKLSRALLRESLFADPPWDQRFAAQVAGVHQWVSEQFGAAQARGEISRSADAGLFGAAFLSFYYFALLAWAQGGHPDPLRLFKRLLAQHLEGLR
jgi:AcrR family transcriptional regulator